MPPNRHRSSNPQGRQKSCSECAKAKRRCDLRQPSCLRCSRQGLTCSYPPQPSSNATPASQSDSSSTEAIISKDLLRDEFPTIPIDQDVELLDFDFGIGAGSVDVLNDLLNGNIVDSLEQPQSTGLAERTLSTTRLSPLTLSRLEYCFEQLKLAPSMMVSANCTPWSHAYLYDEHMPRSLQDAHAACALYITKNDTNANFVAKHIMGRAKELADSPMSTSPNEILARAHALILYQIMLIFGSDIRYFSQAEATILCLEEIGIALHALTQKEQDPAGSLQLYPSAAARTAWKAYIFRESARRTLLSLFQFSSLCSVLCGRISTCAHYLVNGNRVTLSAHLWNARSAYEFAIAWNEKQHFLIKELDFTNMLEIATPSDIDVFGRTILTGLMGIDDVRGWFHTRGGEF